jgi:hypothetical protein
MKHKALFLFSVVSLNGGCALNAQDAEQEKIGSSSSPIIAGTLVTTTQAEDEGLANVNYVPDIVHSGSGVVVNRRYLITAKHVVDFSSHPSDHEIVMGNQRSRASHIWLDGGADLAVVQLDPPLTVAHNVNYQRPLAPRNVVAGDLILMAGSSPNCSTTVSDTRPHRYAFLPVSSAGGNGYTVSQTFGSPVNYDCDNGNVHICTYGDSGGANLLIVNNVSHLGGITSTGSTNYQNGYFATCSSVDVHARSGFIDPIIANDTDIYFAPSWNIPYDNNTSVWKTFDPCDNACFTLDYSYEFEQGYDTGHVQVMPANTLTQHTGSGSVSQHICGNVTFAVFSDGSIQKRGFYDVKATCD